MNSNVLTNCELYELLEIIHSLTFIDNTNQFIEIALSFTQLIEFDFIIFGLPDFTFEKPQDIVDLNINYPRNWVELYQEKNFCRIDPVVLATKEKSAPQYWTDIYKKYPPNKYFAGLAHDFGLKAGWTCLNKGLTGIPWTIISLGGEHKKYKNNNNREKYILERIAPHFHIALSSLKSKFKPLSLQGKLTKREDEVIKWLSQGKTSWEISVILNVAEATINFHVKNIKAKLNTSNRSQAVAVAAQWLAVNNMF